MKAHTRREVRAARIIAEWCYSRAAHLLAPLGVGARHNVKWTKIYIAFGVLYAIVPAAGRLSVRPALVFRIGCARSRICSLSSLSCVFNFRTVQLSARHTASSLVKRFMRIPRESSSFVECQDTRVEIELQRRRENSSRARQLLNAALESLFVRHIYTKQWSREEEKKYI